MAIRVFHQDTPDRKLPMISSDAGLIVWPGNGAETAPMVQVNMEPGEANVVHSHAESEDAIYFLEGKGSIEDATHGVVHEFEAGQVAFVPPGVEHAVAANRGARVRSIGGPAPTDYAMLERMGIEVE